MADDILMPPDSAQLVTTLARDWAFQVNISTTAEPEWIFVNGLSKVGPTTDQTKQDDGDIHSGGYKSQLATAIGANVEIEGLRKGTLAGEALTPDPGQEFLRAKGRRIGYGNIAHVRYWRTDALPDAMEAQVTVEWKDGTEDKEGLQTFTCTLTGRGKPKEIAKPKATP
ncbi:phage tail tube protein [Rhodococcus globerulus]|uniref:phage tail tube protein n=1 Tax=Rhodococcus globerulus TaxID=33008 RepID=UPI0027A51FAF